MKRLNCTRAWLATLALLALVAFGVMAFFLGATLNPAQIAILAGIVGAISKDVSGAFAYFFDGVPKKTEPPTTESTQ